MAELGVDERECVCVCVRVCDLSPIVQNRIWGLAS